MKYLTHDKDEMQKLAAEVIAEIGKREKEAATVVGLYGELGSGKTTFTQGLASSLGISERVVSPTFVIEKIYELSENIGRFKHLIHIDAYRIEKPEELLKLGWKEIISNSENLILIEWPELVAEIMPEHIQIKFTHISENEREVEVVEN